MTSDSAAIFFEGIKNTLAGLYAAVYNAQPIIARQFEILVTMRLLGNILLFVCFLMIFFILFATHKEAQGVVKYTDIKIKRRWLIVMFAVFGVSVAIFNIYPGVALAALDKQVSASSTPEGARIRLFGDEAENGVHNASN